MGETREEVVESKKAPEKPCAETKSQKRRIYKNVLLVSISFLLLFVAFESMSKLQSSINTVDNLGLWSSVVIYASLILSCLFIPSWVISKLTLKWTMVASILCYSTYIAAQFYPQVSSLIEFALPTLSQTLSHDQHVCTRITPQFYSLLPTGAVVGLAAAPLWSAKCSYLTRSARRSSYLHTFFYNSIHCNWLQVGSIGTGGG